jgi:hypothetical protein
MALSGHIRDRRETDAIVESSVGPTKASDPSTLTRHEKWWRDHYQLFERRGYRLRARFSPEWTPSWRTSGRTIEECEDAVVQKVSTINDSHNIWLMKDCSLEKL